MNVTKLPRIENNLEMIFTKHETNLEYNNIDLRETSRKIFLRNIYING